MYFAQIFFSTNFYKIPFDHGCTEVDKGRGLDFFGKCGARGPKGCEKSKEMSLEKSLQFI